jgi:hypothetical protein
MFVSRKKLRIIALVSISILVIVFAFAAISFTNSSTLARSNRQKQTSQSAQRKTIYRTPAIIIAGNSDMNKKNIRDDECNEIGTRDINDIIPIWTTKTVNDNNNYEIITCPIDDYTSLPFFRLADDLQTKNKKGETISMPQYISNTNLYLIINTEAVSEVFKISEVSNEHKAKVSKQAKIYDGQCRTKRNQTLAKDSVVKLSDPITTKWCKFGNNQRSYVVEIQKNTYVAIEDLRPIKKFNV